MANWISYIKDDLGSGDDTRDGMITNGPTHGVQLSQELPPLVGFTTIGSSGTLHVAGTIKLDGQLKDGDDAFGTSGQVLSSDGTDTKWVSSGSLAAGAAAQVAINDDSNTNAERFITLVDSSSGNNNVKTDTSLKYNPSTNTITTANISGTILTASQTNITSVGTLNTLTVNGTINVNNGNVIQLHTSTNNNLRGYIQATETNDAHLIIATSGGEDIAFKDGGLGGTTNMRIRGDGNVIVTGSVTANGFSGDLTGNADTATKFAAAINIGGVSFDGSTAINLPGVNQVGNQDTSGNAATATVLQTERAFSISGDITANSINFNGSGAVALSATIDNNAVDKNCMANEAVGEPELHISNGGSDGQFLQKQSGNNGGLTWATVTLPTAGTLSGSTLASGVTASSLTTVGTLGQNLLIDNGSSTLVTVRCDNDGNAIVRAGGESQGTGVFEVSQDNGSHGGGISYNGDASPSFVSGETADHVTFYRIDSGTRTEVFHYPYNSNVVNFNSVPTVGGTNLARTTDDITGNAATATTATNSSTSKIRTDSGDAYHNLVFVDSGSDNQNQTLKMDDETSRLQWNPHQENLVVWTAQVQGLRQWSDGSLGSSGQFLRSNGGNSWTWENVFVTGMIMIWSGSTGSIPSGWVLCNGSNSTPDLRNRFVIGAGNSYAVGATGGYTDSIVVSHNHSTNNHNHSWSGTTNSTGNHQHTQDGHPPHYDAENVSFNGWAISAGGGQDYSNRGVGNNTGSHSHTVSGTTGNSNPSTNSTGVSGSNRNLPPYYALCYIMKT